MLEFVIHKSQGGRDQVKTFSNRYLYDGPVVLTTNAARDVLFHLMEVEQKIYSTDTSFVRGTIRDVDHRVRPIRGRVRSIPLNAIGDFELPTGSKLAPAHVCAVVERQAALGRPGLGYYRHCVTIEEYAAWVDNRALPARFNNNYVVGGGNPSSLWLALRTHAGLGGLQAVLPDAWGDNIDGPRPITNIVFGGFRMNDPIRPKKSHRQETVEGIQAQINHLARLARRVWNEQWGGTLTPSQIAGVLELALQAARIWYSTPVSIRGRLRRPRIFLEPGIPWVDPGNLPMLPFSG